MLSWGSKTHHRIKLYLILPGVVLIQAFLIQLLFLIYPTLQSVILQQSRISIFRLHIIIFVQIYCNQQNSNRR